jgi:hypothetical protein
MGSRQSSGLKRPHREQSLHQGSLVVGGSAAKDLPGLLDAGEGRLEDVARGALAVESPTRPDRERAAVLLRQYRDLKIGYVDATTVAIAERLKEARIATTDRRRFLAIQPRHLDAFELLPESD